MDLVYKIYSVWLYDDGLKHDYMFFYDKSVYDSSIPYEMFGNSDWCASHRIYNMAHEVQSGFLKQETFLYESEKIMLNAASNSGMMMIKASDFLELVKTDIKAEHITHKDYSVYDIYWNETKSGINPHLWQLGGVWNIGQSTYSTYRIYEYIEEREKAHKIWWRDKQLNSLLDD